MSAPEITMSKDGALNEIWAIVTTLTDEATARALKKCKDAGFDPDRGIVSLQESFINLAAVRSLLEDAIDKRKLIQLSLTIQLGFAITFCTVQYSRERRLEEEYAFKSSISVSLNPYRDLVHSILEKNGNVDQNKYTDFVIDSVRNVFTPPTDKVFDTEKKPSGLTRKTLKETAELLER